MRSYAVDRILGVKENSDHLITVNIEITVTFKHFLSINNG